MVHTDCLLLLAGRSDAPAQVKMGLCDGRENGYSSQNIIAFCEKMDRLDAMTALVAAVDEGSLSAAARRLRRSPAAMTRAIAFLEHRIGARLLDRTTRRLRLTDAGERFLATCRRVLDELEQAETRLAAEPAAAPRGLLSVTAPALFGRLKVRPLVDAFLDRYPEVQVRLFLTDRVVNLMEEGVDVAVRLGSLPDSSLIAVKVGEVRRILCASPRYLANASPIRVPADLAHHVCIAFSQAAAGHEIWRFGPGPQGSPQVRINPRLAVNGAEAAVASAVEGRGVTRVLSYQAETQLARQQLTRLLQAYEPAPVPVHVVCRQGLRSTAKVRAFVDLLVPKLRAGLSRPLGGRSPRLP
jgi:DNA-binding transcriptional LysR family regulator